MRPAPQRCDTLALMLFRHSLALIATLVTLPVAAQTRTPAVRAAARPVSAALKPYLSCKLPGGPELVQTTPLPQTPVTRKAVTLTGTKEITISDGAFSAFSFPGSAPFANVKSELLPATRYSTEKSDMISEFDAINAKGENTQRNYALKPTLNGFEIYGFDRTAITPDEQLLGMYVFFDNPHHIATTAYFLNAPAAQRRFSTIQDYNGLRESFVNAYTLCVRKALGGSAPAKPATTAKPVHHAAKRR